MGGIASALAPPRTLRKWSARWSPESSQDLTAHIRRRFWLPSSWAARGVFLPPPSLPPDSGLGTLGRFSQGHVMPRGATPSRPSPSCGFCPCLQPETSTAISYLLFMMIPQNLNLTVRITCSQYVLPNKKVQMKPLGSVPAHLTHWRGAGRGSPLPPLSSPHEGWRGAGGIHWVPHITPNKTEGGCWKWPLGPWRLSLPPHAPGSLQGPGEPVSPTASSPSFPSLS